MKKKIGILGWNIGDNSFGITKAYYHYFDQFGEVIIISPGAALKEDLDLLVLPGGQDVNPERYGEWPSVFTGPSNTIFEWFDEVMLQKYIDANIPIFGICRGLQTLNVHFNGTLYQHLRTHAYSSDHRGELVHPVYTLAQYTQNKNNTGKKKDIQPAFKVNSLHHQAIKDVGQGLRVLLVSSLVRPLVEAIEHETLAVAAVQWHPEEIYDQFSDNLITKLLERKVQNEQA